MYFPKRNKRSYILNSISDIDKFCFAYNLKIVQLRNRDEYLVNVQ